MKVGDKISYQKPTPISYDSVKGCKYENVRYDVTVMAIAKGYAMLRRPRCAPFVESVKDIEKWRR